VGIIPPMQTVLKNILLVVILFSFNACQLFEDSPELQQKKQELELKKLQAMQDKELAAIEMQKSLATIEKEKTLELQKLQNEIKSIELNANSEKELELIKQKVLLQENANSLNFQLYLFVFLILLISVISFFVFYYAKKKREDELRAYNDNLKKYFYHKENETRMEISKMILSTIAQGNLSKENERKLIQAFAADQHDYDNDAEIIASIEAPKEKDEL
jgi:hypothetical protein